MGSEMCIRDRADIAGTCNEAAIIAARNDRKQVTIVDFHAAIDRTIGGLERKSLVISKEQKIVVAYHEAGHAVASWFLEHASPLIKVSIIPRGVAALGYAQYLPKDRYLSQIPELEDEACVLLAARASEEIKFGTVSTGASDDLQRVTKLVYGMIEVYGMNTEVGNFSFTQRGQRDSSFGTKPYSEDTAQMIDREARKMVDAAYQRALDLLREHWEGLEQVAQLLLKKEVIYKADMERILGPRTSSAQTTDAAALEFVADEEKGESTQPD